MGYTHRNPHREQDMKISLLSLGNLGTAVAHLLAINGHEVLAWEHDPAVVVEVNEHHRNSRYLQGVSLHPGLKASNDINELMVRADMLVSCLPSRFVLPVLQPIASQLPAAVRVVNMGKGMSPATGLTVMQQLEQLFPENPLAMLCGPSLANEMVHGVNTVLVAASADPFLPALIRQVFESERLSVLMTADVRGTELGGILKNAYAVGLGFASAGGRPGRNFVGAYLTCALSEMCRVGKVLGATEQSFYVYSGLGDLLATALSDKSHNFTLGKLLGDGMSLQQVQDELGLLPEGFNTLQSIITVGDREGVDVPLARLLHQACFDRLTIHQFFDLFNACVRAM